MEKQSKRTILFIGSLCEGGAERVCSILASEFAEVGRDVEILTYYDQVVTYPPNPRVFVTSIERETKTKNIVKNIFWLRQYLRENAKCIISFLAVFNMIAVVASAFLGIPLVVSDRNDPRRIPANPIIRFFRDFLYLFADGVVLQTGHNQKYFSRRIQKKSVVIPNPLDLGNNRAIAISSRKKNEIVAVGRLVEQKNHEMLIHAFAKVHQQYPEYRLTIYGEGPLKNYLKALSKSLGLESSVNLPGYSSAVHVRIAEAKIFVLSSKHEGMPNSLLEALGIGLPVISTEVSGATELIMSGKNGILVPCGDVQALTAAMLRMIDDDGLRLLCAENAISINEQLEAKRICRQWIDYLQSIHAER